MNLQYEMYRKRIGNKEVDKVDAQLMRQGFTNEVIANYRRLLKSKHDDPDLYLGIAFWYGIRRIGTNLEALEKYYHTRAVLSCKNYNARKFLMQYIQDICR